jgi:fatty acid synthase
MKEGIENGTVRPMKRTIFDIDKSEEAFRYMASGKHMGKVIIKIRDEEHNEVSTNSLKMLAIPRTVFKSNKSYIITGGLGGFGLELVNWMIERGAHKFVLTSRTGPKEPYQYYRLKYFADIGVKVIISTKDVSTPEGAQQLITEASSLGPIGGIFHLSMVLSDGLFENQTIESFKKVCAPKSTAILNLDTISRQVCDQIDYFVAFSSVSCGVGNPGQSNYGLANSVMERVCDLRRADGLHGFAIQWGAIGDVGYVIDNIRGNDVVICGSLPQRIPSCLSSLDRLLQSEYSVCSSIIKADFQFESMGIKANLMKTVAHILGLKEYSNLDSNTTLVELGMDSLMGVEVKQTLERDYELVLSMQDIRKLSISKILEISAGISPQCDASKPEKQILSNESSLYIPTEMITYLNDIMNGDPVIFLPPVDGTYTLLKQIAKSLNRPAIGLNWTLDCKDLKTIEETATHFINVINKALPNISDNYDIIGYSYGGVVGYEIGIQLQKRSKCFRKLILLDSSPPQFKLDTEEVVRFHKLCDEESGYIEALISFLMDNVSVDYQKVKSLLQNTPKEERTAKVSQIFLESAGIQCDPQTVAFAAESHSNKLFMLNTYSTDKIKFSGNILLLRANEHVVNELHTNHIIKHDYGLSEVLILINTH